MFDSIYDSQMQHKERVKELSDSYRHGKADQELVVSQIRKVLNWLGHQFVVAGEKLQVGSESPSPQF